jgi:hypothetical protein
MQAATRWQVVVDAAALDSEERAIARSVLYAALFEYPLTLAQLRQTLIESTHTATEIVAIYTRSAGLQAAIDWRDGYFFPRGKEVWITERRRREAASRVFLRRHRTLLRLIAVMPYVRMVALSGSIAHLNLAGDGDLDLFIVTRGEHVWSVTVAAILLAKLLGRRRTLCANFVLSDAALALGPQDLFTASQIIHLKPIVGDDLFRRLLRANPFVARFYPNFHAAPTFTAGIGRIAAMAPLKRAVEWLGAVPASIAEALCRRLYRTYLTRRAATWQSPEQVRLERHCLKLHTQSHRDAVLTRFDRAMTELSQGHNGDKGHGGDARTA